MAALLIVLIVLLLLVLLRYTRPVTPSRVARGSGERVLGRAPSIEAQWEERVLLLTRGDRAALERAVKNRQQRFPQATRAELLQRVHDDYVKDRE